MLSYCSLSSFRYSFLFFFFNDTATTEIYTLSLHDALPIWHSYTGCPLASVTSDTLPRRSRSEEHTSELQSQSNLVCRLLLEKKKNFRKVRFSCSGCRSEIRGDVLHVM